MLPERLNRRRHRKRIMNRVFLTAVACLRIFGLARNYRQASIDEKVFRELLSGLTIGPTPEAVCNVSRNAPPNLYEPRRCTWNASTPNAGNSWQQRCMEKAFHLWEREDPLKVRWLNG